MIQPVFNLINILYTPIRGYSLRLSWLTLILLSLPTSPLAAEESISAQSIIRAAMDNWRGTTSYSEVEMTIKRKNWERTMSMAAWTSGEEKSLIRITAPAKDAGNATLTNDDNMWSYSPKINRVIKIPSSMMNQNWMGSDFSNKDISRSTDIIDQYTHTIVDQKKQDGHWIYTIESTPKEDAPVVWGKEVLVIRDDFVIVRQEYWDQDNRLVKIMETKQIAVMSGRPLAKTMRMYKTESPEEWTQINNLKVEFDLPLLKSVFTLSNLRNPRR